MRAVDHFFAKVVVLMMHNVCMVHISCQREKEIYFPPTIDAVGDIGIDM